MAIQVQRFIQETQAWRTVRIFEDLPEAQEFSLTLPWANSITNEQWDEFERISLALSVESAVWNDVIMLINQMGGLIIRHSRPPYDERGFMYINIGLDHVVLECIGYTKVVGEYMHNEVPYSKLRECVKWIHAK